MSKKKKKSQQSKKRRKQLKKNRAKRQAKAQRIATQQANYRRKQAQRTNHRIANKRNINRFNDLLTGAFDSPISQAKARVFLRYTQPMWEGRRNEDRVQSVLDEIAKKKSQQTGHKVSPDDLNFQEIVDTVWRMASESDRQSAIREAESRIAITYMDTDTPEWQALHRALYDEYAEYIVSGRFTSAGEIARAIG